MEPAAPPRTPPRGLRSPAFMMFLNIVLSTAAELMLKEGAVETAGGGGGVFGIAALASWWTWAGIGAYVVSLLTWLEILRWMPLSLAFALQSVQYVLIPLGAWAFRGEVVDPRRWVAVGLVMAGVVLIGLGRRQETHRPAVAEVMP
ncbi:MAG TPA: hypothetical protein VK324_01335 [Tepidisphaeraceae bacterium]|nr:hypothetical protein [Tepidisphaeraceae bacterium]